jgi:hypothetical protein
MMIDRRKFLGGVLAAGVVAVGASAVGANTASAAAPSGSASRTGSTESFLLSTGRRALG